MKKSNISKEYLATRLDLSIDELKEIIQDYNKISFADILKISSILNCLPNELIRTNRIVRPNVYNIETLVQYHFKIWFAVKTIVSVLYENNNEFKIDDLVSMAAWNYAMILISELWNPYSNQPDDVSIEKFLEYSADILDESYTTKIKKIKKEYNRFKESNKELIRRLKQSRDKQIAHLTISKSQIIQSEDDNNKIVNHLETQFILKDLKLVVNKLVVIINETLEFINELKEPSDYLEKINEYNP